MNEFDLTLIVPCFNEEQRFALTTWMDYLQKHPRFFFVFVNDGSTDDTQKVVARLHASNEHVSVVTLKKNIGKAEAVRAGVRFAIDNSNCKTIGFIDADLAIPLSEIDRFVQFLLAQPHVDVIMASRVQMLGKRIKRSTLRHYMSRIVATCICKILDEPVYDTQCGLKIFRKDTAALLVQEPFISKWLFDVELLARYKTHLGSTAFNEQIVEMPLNRWTETKHSKLKLHHLPGITLDLLAIWKKYFRYEKGYEYSPGGGVNHQL